MRLYIFICSVAAPVVIENFTILVFVLFASVLHSVELPGKIYRGFPGYDHVLAAALDLFINLGEAAPHRTSSGSNAKAMTQGYKTIPLRSQG